MAKKDEDPGLAQRRKDSERAQREAEEGTGDRKDKGYAGSGDHFVETGTSADAEQSSVEQRQNQEAGKPINGDAKTGE